MSRRALSSFLVTAAVAAPASLGLAAEPPLTVYVGTYTDGASRGIYRTSVDLATGRASAPVLAGEAKNPSFLALHPGGRYLYAVSETDEVAGEKTGEVLAFAIDAATGELRLLNRQPSRGAAPCHLVVDKGGRNVLVANYGGGNVAVLPIGADGRLAPASSVRAHEGGGPNAGRQQRPHAHGIYLDAAERFAFAPDLGADRVFVYRFDAAKGTLDPHGSAALEPGSGPRHMAFHPSGRHAYVINELSSTITTFAYDAAKGELARLDTVKTLPDGFTGTSYTAEVEVSKDGRFVYGSNRGHDSIAIFTVDAATGKLKASGHQSTGGKTPRNFVVDPTGRWLLAENQDSNTIVVFRIDPTTGALKQAGEPVASPMPVCIRMLPKPASGK
jgi:6-phosphogluconolactonase